MPTYEFPIKTLKLQTQLNGLFGDFEDYQTALPPAGKKITFKLELLLKKGSSYVH